MLLGLFHLSSCLLAFSRLVTSSHHKHRGDSSFVTVETMRSVYPWFCFLHPLLTDCSCRVERGCLLLGRSLCCWFRALDSTASVLLSRPVGLHPLHSYHCIRWSFATFGCVSLGSSILMVRGVGFPVFALLVYMFTNFARMRTNVQTMVCTCCVWWKQIWPSINCAAAAEACFVVR